MKVSLLLVIASILSQAYTLSPLRDDLAVLQHHPYQIRRITDPLYLAKRQQPAAALYFDQSPGRIKVIFNLNINFIVGQMLGNAGANLARSLLTDLTRFGMESLRVRGSDPNPLQGANWEAQIGADTEAELQRPNAVITVGILITLDVRFRSLPFTLQVISMLQQWFQRGGYKTLARRVANAAIEGDIGPRLREGRSITERQTVRARSDSKFCISPIQNWIFVVVPGKLDGLLPTLITC